MTSPAAISKESIKSLGPGAFLVTALPSIVLVLTVFALIASRLTPGVEPMMNNCTEVEPGTMSVLTTVESLGVAGGILLALTVLCVAVLLRPLQISLVQFLEGYWDRLGRHGFLQALAVERHLRTRGRAVARRSPLRRRAPSSSLGELAEEARRSRGAARLKERATGVLARYPVDPGHVMPTSLGNVLRRTETLAGERYGLVTVETYPRLYQQVSARLEAEIGSQLDTLDSTATFVILFGAQTMLTLPLVFRLDAWSWTPAVFGALAMTAYVGAVRAAAHYGSLVEVAYDLHRFDLIEAMHLRLPDDPQQEREQNQALSNFLAAPTYPKDVPPPTHWRYQHPTIRPVTDGPVTVAVEAGGPDKASEGSDGDPDRAAGEAAVGGPDAPAGDNSGGGGSG